VQNRTVAIELGTSYRYNDVMSEYALVIDSVADLPRDLVEYWEIFEVPFPVFFGNQIFRDKIDLKAKQFFQMLRSKLDYPKTSGPPVGEYLALFQRLIAKGKKILALTIPAKNSGAFQSATLAKSLLESGEVDVIDSGTISMGLGLLAIEAAQAIRDGCSRETILARIQGVMARVQILAVLPDLSWAARGGRVSSAVARLAALLKVHPMIRLRHGVIELVSKAAPSQTIEKLVQRVNMVVGNHPARVAVLHADILEEALKLKVQLSQEIDCQGEIYISEIGPALGTHSGPDALGVAFYPLGEGMV
jgi:DegV family protein with EDD domain